MVILCFTVPEKDHDLFIELFLQGVISCEIIAKELRLKLTCLMHCCPSHVADFQRVLIWMHCGLYMSMRDADLFVWTPATPRIFCSSGMNLTHMGI